MVNCYYCNNPKTSKEHVPPKLLFRGFDVDSITVPSCDKHNNSKSGDDKNFVYAMLRTLKSTSPPFDWQTEVLKAIKKAEKSFPETNNRIIESPILDEEFAGLNIPLARTDKPMLEWVRHITAGLVYSWSLDKRAV